MTLPGGTVTFLFTDVESSTRLLQELGDDYGQIVADHRRLLREVFQSAGGNEVDTQGDAFFYSFSRARDAVGARSRVSARSPGTNGRAAPRCACEWARRFGRLASRQEDSLRS